MTLKQWLSQKKMTQEELAAKVDGTCTQALVSKWVRREVAPSAARVERLISLSGGQLTPAGLAKRAR